MAVAVVDPQRGSSHVVLGRRSELPARMARTSELVAAMRTAPGAETLDAAIVADLKSAQVAQADWSMHRAILLRAIRDLHA